MAKRSPKLQADLSTRTARPFIPRTSVSAASGRAGDITSETQTLSGISGIAGAGTQSFTYDNLHRVTGSSISGGPTQTYAYDADSNRTSWNDGTATTTYDYNETDEMVGQHRSGSDRWYAYDANGNMTESAVSVSGATTYTYDAQDRLTSITPPSGGAIGFTLDALGRHRTKSIGGTLADTYGYAGTSEAVVRIDHASDQVSAAIDGQGNRVATATSTGGLGWTLPSLHGDMAAMLTSDGSSIGDAFRYDAYGVTIASATSALPTPWRYQGRLLLNTADGGGANTDLYDFVARAYDPALGAFTSLDTVAGSAQNPLTLNRFLYANANPTTLIDPTGHMAIIGERPTCAYYAACSQKDKARAAYLSHLNARQRTSKAEAATNERRQLDPDYALRHATSSSRTMTLNMVTSELSGIDKGSTKVANMIMREASREAELLRSDPNFYLWPRAAAIERSGSGWAGSARAIGKAAGAIGTMITGLTGFSDQWGKDPGRGNESRFLRASTRAVFRAGASVLGAGAGATVLGAACIETGPGAIACAVAGGAVGGAIGSVAGDFGADYVLGWMDSTSRTFDFGRHTASDIFDAVTSWLNL